tara:strand:+ start:300 stop:476 length:177 start_codon:yes stop_codon:yes gene_type:complete
LTLLGDACSRISDAQLATPSRNDSTAEKKMKRKRRRKKKKRRRKKKKEEEEKVDKNAF